jgi:protein-tyrosine-phosphatase
MNILFVCTGNTFRSMSAHYLMEKYVKDNNIKNVSVDSAGINLSKSNLEDFTINLLKSYDVDVSNHIPKFVSKKLLDNSDLIISIAKNHQVFLKKEFSINSVLFNEICFNKNSSVKDVGEAIKNYKINPDKGHEHIKKIITYLFNSIPVLVSNLK